MMLFQVLQDVSFLILSGVGLYAIWASHRLARQLLLKQTLIGLVLGGVFFLISTNTAIGALEQFHLDAGAGPLFFASFLGGLPGALIAGGISLLMVFPSVSQDPSAGVGLYLMIVALGALSRRVVQIKTDRVISRFAVLAGLFSLWLAHGASYVLSVILSRPEALSEWVSCLVLGSLSVLAMSAVIAVSNQVFQTQKEASELSYRLNMATKTGRMGVFEHRQTAPDVSFDQGMMRLFQLDGAARDVPLTDWIERIHPADQARLMKTIKDVAVKGSTTDQVEFRGVMPDGSIRYFQANWVTEREANGDFIRAVGVHVDLTEHKMSEDRKTYAEQRLAAIAANLPGAVMVAEKEAGKAPVLVYANAYSEEIFGYTIEEMTENPTCLVNCITDDQRDSMIADINTAAQSLSPLHRRCLIKDKNGVEKWLDYHANSVRIDDKRIRTDSIILDVTNEVETQRLLKEQSALATQAQKMESIGQLTGGVAHDFNNLLAVIIGNLELLSDEVENKDHRQMIDAGVGAALRGADLTRKMLAFARRSRLEPQTIDLNAIVRETETWAGRTLPANINIATSLLAGLWPVKADQASTESALLNLILNARDAMPNGGQLTLETANVRIDDEYVETRGEELEPGRYVMLAVSDTGTGIDPKVLAFVFEPFYTTKAPGAGSGLGLSMVQGFMRQTGGTVRAYSEAGVGTTFKLYFPIGAAEDLADTNFTQKTVVQQSTGARILLAEDQEDVLEVLVQTLTKNGYQVTAAKSGDEAKEIFLADPSFDMLLTDIVMPGRLQGTTLARELRDIREDLPVAFMSGYASEATVHGNGLRPEDIRLMKPVQKRDLLAAIDLLLAETPAEK